jgi:hypothetical protein
MLIVVWIGVAVAIGVLASRWGRNGLARALFGILLSPLLAGIGPARAEPASLFAGIKIPKGYVDGWTYSLRSLSECNQLMARVPLDAPARPHLKCIVKDDEKLKPPMS